MKHGVTGGQYSLARGLFGAYLFVHFSMLAPWAAELFSNEGVISNGRDSPLLLLFPNVLALADSPAFATGFVAFGALCAIPFAFGFRDRWFALALYYVWACLFGRNPFISNPGIPYVGWLLLMHVFVPRAPYGSWDARGRPDPRGGWALPVGLFIAAWWVMAAGYSFSGYTKLISPSWVDGTAVARVLQNPLARPWFLNDLLLALPEAVLTGMTWVVLLLELLFLPLALSRRVRPWLWLSMVGMHVGLVFLVDFADLTFGMLMVHLFTFDPAWVKPRFAERTEMIFYDGYCGLCHRACRFVLSEDRLGTAFRFAPLQGELFANTVDEATRKTLPDSVIVVTQDGQVLTRSSGVVHLMQRLGGWWRLIATVVAVVPAPIRDAGYDFVARIRHRVFKREKEACPILPPELRERFDY